MNRGTYCGCLLALAVMSALLWCTGGKAEEAAGDNVAFRWAFGAMVGPMQERKFVPIVADTALKTGDQLKCMLELHKPCFVYLIYQSSQGDMNMLFPYQLDEFGNDYTLMRTYYVPRNDTWFELDDKSGTETFYLIASASRLHELEGLFQKNPSGADGSSRSGLIRAQIKALQKQHRTLTASAERPVPIGGNVRGLIKDEQTKAPDTGAGAIEVSAKDFYCRTFTIEHK
jgi:hypothetical protein